MLSVVIPPAVSYVRGRVETETDDGATTIIVRSVTDRSPIIIVDRLTYPIDRLTRRRPTRPDQSSFDRRTQQTHRNAAPFSQSPDLAGPEEHKPNPTNNRLTGQPVNPGKYADIDRSRARFGNLIFENFPNGIFRKRIDVINVM